MALLLPGASLPLPPVLTRGLRPLAPRTSFESRLTSSGMHRVAETAAGRDRLEGSVCLRLAAVRNLLSGPSIILHSDIHLENMNVMTTRASPS